VAAITSDTDTQIATVRPGVLPRLRPRAGRADVVELPVEGESALRVSRRERDDDVEALARAEAIVGVGSAVPPERYGELDGLLGLLGAELAATRKVTDRGWLPRARQIGITGRTVEPRLYVALGVAGKFNHVVGVRRAGTVLAVNRDPDAPIFSACDIGIVGDWAEVVAGLTRRLRQAGIASAGRNGWTSITSAAG
jgi:electron transfer flavoprotein alpha subunit